MDSHHPSLRSISKKYFTTTKRWWISVWLLKLSIFVIGVPAIIWPQANFYFTFITAGLVLAAEICDWCTSHFRSKAETLLRKLDLYDSFGWEIRETEVADAAAELPVKFRSRLPGDTGEYFASKESEGAKRAMENLRESAWWSKHLANSMKKILFFVTCILLLISLATLIFSSNLIQSTDQAVTISRIVISILLLVVSLRLVPLTLNYRSFSEKSGEIEKVASSLLKSGDDNKTQAVKAFNEYHLARASSPLIPTWIWKWRRDSLNEAWDTYVAKNNQR